MVANKWLAGRGTRALSESMLFEEGLLPASEPFFTEEDGPYDTLLCVGQDLLGRPQTLGLLDAQCFDLPFVRVVCGAAQARQAFDQPDCDCAFICSADDMPALNLAAALKRDWPSKQVFVVADSDTPGFNQRVDRAKIDGLIHPTKFYKELLKRHIKPPVAQNEFSENLSETPDESSIGEIAQNQVEVLEPDTVPLEVYAADALTAEAYLDEMLEEPLLEEPPVTALALPDALPSPLSQRAFYLPVIGASGGTGKSTIAYLSALCSARFGCKTLLIDFDMQFGDMGLLSRSDQAVSFDKVLEDPSCIRKLEAGPEGFALITACQQPEHSEQVMENLDCFFAQAASCFDVIVSNGPTFWNDQHMALLERAGKIFFVLDQRIHGAKAAQKAFDLCARCGLATSPFLFLLNKCGRQPQLTSLDIACAVQGAQCRELPDGGREVSEYCEAGQGADLLDEGNCLAEALRELLMDVLPGCSVLKGLKPLRRSPFSLFSRKCRKEE